jgi:hypothetical protein
MPGSCPHLPDTYPCHVPTSPMWMPSSPLLPCTLPRSLSYLPRSLLRECERARHGLHCWRPELHATVFSHHPCGPSTLVDHPSFFVVVRRSSSHGAAHRCRPRARHGPGCSALWPSPWPPCLYAFSCLAATTTTVATPCRTRSASFLALTFIGGRCHRATIVAAACCRGRAAVGLLAPIWVAQRVRASTLRLPRPSADAGVASSGRGSELQRPPLFQIPSRTSCKNLTKGRGHL